MQLNGVQIESQSRRRHVQAPDPCRAQARFGNRLIPVRFQVVAPVLEGECVVLAEVLLVPDLEARIVHRAHDVPRPRELAIGKDVAVDEKNKTIYLLNGTSILEFPARHIK